METLIQYKGYTLKLSTEGDGNTWIYKPDGSVFGDVSGTNGESIKAAFEFIDDSF